ncbi:variable large family protein [Borrelia sp. HM]|uniref:variable large family protein n=1 Tax=Borrelia sp. HM TaxID=1882662 RepID=UPI00210697DA|nr:variable large family protein [Borrelia sp. HM]
MILSLLLGCNNGGEDPQKVFLKSVVSLGNDFLNIFTSFGDMISGLLGFNKDPKKSDVANYFNKLKETVQGTKDKLEKIVAEMRTSGNPNAEATDVAVKALIDSKLSKIIEGAKKASGAIGDDASDKIGNVAAGGTGGAGNGAKGDGVDNLIEGIKDIVDVVLKGKDKYNTGDDKKAADFSATRTATANNGEAGKLFVTDAGTASNVKNSAADAAKAVGAVTGADILQAMVKDDGSAKLAKNNDGNVGTEKPKDATIAGGIALRAMAKNGKFANANDADGVNSSIAASVQGTALSAVTKALDTLTIAIRKTIDEELKKVKEAMKINPETTPATVEAGHAAK